MKISFLGATKTVTGSLFLIQTATSQVIIDCGMFQGGRAMEDKNDENFVFDVADIDAVILTHAHIDHSGRLPKLVKDGFKGVVYATQATRDLCEIMLADSAHIQKMDAEWETRKKMRKGEQEVEPMYTQQDVDDTMKLFQSIEYGNQVRITDDIVLNFINSGHMLGSAYTELYITENGKTEKYTITGDIGNFNQPILKDPDILPETDYLIMESTYGNRYHSDITTYRGALLEIIIATLSRGGNVVIPAFSVGRTQEVLYEINHYKENNLLGRFNDVNVVVDSPLAIQATEVFKKHYDITDDATQRLMRNGDDPLVFDGLLYSITTEESIAVNSDPTPKIILSASGMCDAGRIRHHLKHNLWRKESSVVFVGYQTEGSLGRLLLEGEKEVKLFGEEIAVNAEIHSIDAYSGHADLNGLINTVLTMQRKPGKIVLVHGEQDAMVNLKNELQKRIDVPVFMPEYGDVFDLAQQEVRIDVLAVEPLPVKGAEKAVAEAPVLRQTKAVIRALQELITMLSKYTVDLSENAAVKVLESIDAIKKMVS